MPAGGEEISRARGTAFRFRSSRRQEAQTKTDEKSEPPYAGAYPRLAHPAQRRCEQSQETHSELPARATRGHYRRERLGQEHFDPRMSAAGVADRARQERLGQK